MVHAGAFLNCRLREARKVVVGDRRASREYETGGGCGGCKEQAVELMVMCVTRVCASPQERQ